MITDLFLQVIKLPKFCEVDAVRQPGFIPELSFFSLEHVLKSIFQGQQLKNTRANVTVTKSFSSLKAVVAIEYEKIILDLIQ